MVETAISGAVGILDTVERWLSGLPSSPVTDFLSGAVWTVRRNLQYILKGSHLTWVNKTGQTLAVVKVPNGQRDGAADPPIFIAPGKSAFVDGRNYGSPDIRLRIYTAVQDGSGNWAVGGLAQVIIVSNPAIRQPEAGIAMDPYQNLGEWKNTLIGQGFSVNEAFNADYTLKKGVQSGRTANYVVRLADSNDHKIFRIETFAIPQGFTQDYQAGGFTPIAPV